ncbi:MAG: DUF4442 domain-containing protein [Flavobacteriales bacterium]|nr:DUF4442 domain-containing protein [Flavobacteriales bacterium]
MDLRSLISSFPNSAFNRWRLNFILHRVIPFNRPHRLKVIQIDDEKCRVLLPYRKKNLNHIKGLHACAQTTAAEYASGLFLLNRLGFKKYRIIMKKISAEYHYQAKTSAVAEFSMSNSELEEKVLKPLESEGKVYILCQIELKGENGDHFSMVTTEWQVKSWDSVKTKV